MSYIVLRSHWCNIVLNVHAPNEENSVDSNGSFYENLSRSLVFSKVVYKNIVMRFYLNIEERGYFQTNNWE
jgi:hypothetical protein